MKTIKIARVANRVFWTLAAIGVNVGVGYQWAQLNCEWKSVLMAVMWYTSACFGLYKAIDLQLEEAAHYYQD